MISEEFISLSVIKQRFLFEAVAEQTEKRDTSISLDDLFLVQCIENQMSY